MTDCSICGCELASSEIKEGICYLCQQKPENKDYKRKDESDVPATNNSTREAQLALKNSRHQDVVVTDIQMPFWSMVGFMVKWAIASIPALIILYILFTVAFFSFAVLIKQ